MTISIVGSDFVTGAISSQKKVLSVARAAGEGLIIGVWYRGIFGDPGDDIATVKWDPTGDNQSFTRLQLQNHATIRYLAVYYLPAPTTAKTANIEIAFATGGNVDDCAILARRITGHDTAVAARGSIKAAGTISAATSPETDTISSATNDLVIDFFSHRYDVGFIGASAGQSDVDTRSTAGSFSMGSSSKPGAASVSMGWTSGQTDAEFDYAHIMASIKPGAALTPDATISWTEGADTFAMVAAFTASGTSAAMAWTEGADTFALSATFSTATGTCAIREIRNNTGSLRAGEVFDVVILNATTHAVVAVFLAQTAVTGTGGADIVVVSSLLVAGTTYRVVLVDSSTEAGVGKVTAT